MPQNFEHIFVTKYRRVTIVSPLASRAHPTAPQFHLFLTNFPPPRRRVPVPSGPPDAGRPPARRGRRRHRPRGPAPRGGIVYRGDFSFFLKTAGEGGGWQLIRSEELPVAQPVLGTLFFWFFFICWRCLPFPARVCP